MKIKHKTTPVAVIQREQELYGADVSNIVTQ